MDSIDYRALSIDTIWYWQAQKFYADNVREAMEKVPPVQRMLQTVNLFAGVAT